jgi:hypothetical protein
MPFGWLEQLPQPSDVATVANTAVRFLVENYSTNAQIGSELDHGTRAASEVDVDHVMGEHSITSHAAKCVFGLQTTYCQNIIR